MFGRLKTAILGAVVVCAALVPLFGDPRQTPVTHPIWGRMLLRALDMQDAIRESTQASQVFATLSWRDSLSLPGDRFAKGDGVAVKDDAGVRRVVAGTTPGEVVYPVAVVQGGDYQFRVRMAGDPGRPATAEVSPYRGGRAYKTSPSRRPSRATGCLAAWRTWIRARTRRRSCCLQEAPWSGSKSPPAAPPPWSRWEGGTPPPSPRSRTWP
jgi:hypothetical protein